MSELDVISFTKAAFDDFIVAVTAEEFTPTLVNVLNNLLEQGVKFEPVAWMKDGEFGFGLPETGEVALYRRAD